MTPAGRLLVRPGRLPAGCRQLPAGCPQVPAGAGRVQSAAGRCRQAAGSLPLKWNLKSISTWNQLERIFVHVVDVKLKSISSSISRAAIGKLPAAIGKLPA